MARKPIPGKNHPDDEKFFAEAKITFGDYKLKESSDYMVPMAERETTVKHYKKLLEARGKQYNVRHEFIQTVFDIRDYKYELIEKLKDKQRRIDIINEELPEEFRKNGPPIPTYNPAEFPEEKLQVHVVLPQDQAEEEVEDVNQIIFLQPPDIDELEKQLLPRKTGQTPRYKNGLFTSAVHREDVFRTSEMTFDELLAFPENTDTPIESCMRARRMNRLCLHQRLLISEMQDMIDQFNNWIYEARKQRLPTLIRGNFIDIHIVCLNEELQILKNCKAKEDKLTQIVNSKLSEVHLMEDGLDSLKTDKENQETKLANFKIEEGKVQEKFKMAVESNKFYDFLKKVFKKKFKPPKIKTDDDTSSSSSSSSDESDYEDDTGSIDSRDFGFIKQDLNVCPKGCDPNLFNFTLELRAKRHEIEQAEREEHMILEMTKKDIEIANRKMGILKRAYNEAQEKLEIFRREKQNNLNAVRCVVVLNLDQIYGSFLKPGLMDISDFVVFSRSKLSNLYKRVVLLQNHALDEQGKHDTYLKHLIRMKKDIVYMRRKVHMLKQEIVRMLKIKFGKEVDINELESAVLQRSFQKTYVNELEEVVLKKLVYDLRIKMTDVRGIYTGELEYWQREIVKNQNNLTKQIKENTKRLELLAVISKEKKDMARFVDSQDKKRERMKHMEVIHRESIKDMQKLKDIIDDQNRTIQDLRDEIKMLKTKGMAQEVRKRKERMAEYERLQAAQESKDHKYEPKEWLDYDIYVSDAEEEQPFGKKKEQFVKEKEQFEEEKEQLKTSITIPGYYSTESEDIVRDLIKGLMKDTDQELAKKSTENIVQSILSGIFKCTSIHDYIKEIIDNLPIEDVTDEQHSSVELAAEKLMSIEEPQISEENLLSCVKNILEETLSEVLCHDPHYLIPTVLEKLLETIPVDVISSEHALDEIALSIRRSVGDMRLDKDELAKSLDQVSPETRKDMVDIITAILERVYETGTDFLYVINQ